MLDPASAVFGAVFTADCQAIELKIKTSPRTCNFKTSPISDKDQGKKLGSWPIRGAIKMSNRGATGDRTDNPVALPKSHSGEKKATA